MQTLSKLVEILEVTQSRLDTLSSEIASKRFIGDDGKVDANLLREFDLANDVSKSISSTLKKINSHG